MASNDELPPLAEVDAALAELVLNLQRRFPKASRYAIKRRIMRRAMLAAGAGELVAKAAAQADFEHRERERYNAIDGKAEVSHCESNRA